MSAKKTPKATATKAAKKPAAKQPAKKAKKAAKAKPEPKPKKLSALDAAAKVLGDSGEAMTSKEMIEAMAKKGLWTSPAGKTPHSALYSAILRELNTKAKGSR